MFISEIKIENFRLFGSGSEAFVLKLKPGLTALVGENDAGKTAVIDALRLVLGSRDQEYFRLEPSDFYQSSDSPKPADQISIRCTFNGLTPQDRGAFAEYLTYETQARTIDTALYVTWVAKRHEKNGTPRRYLPIEWRSGEDGGGPPIDSAARFLLMATYLRPLRDAERAMAAGRGSRLSQILQHTQEIRSEGAVFDPNQDSTPDPATLSVLGIGDYANHLLGKSAGIKKTREKLNQDYLSPLSFSGDSLNAQISVSRSRDDATRLRQILEKLDVSLSEAEQTGPSPTRGLGSNNLLFMACELLLLGSEEEGFPILLIEEPEAHLHPQRQLRLMAFLQAQAEVLRAGGQQIQIIVTTHSPNLASDIKLDNLVLIHDRKAFPLARGWTSLGASDYRFLERFLDVTKANLFFARGVVIVEGDAENILLPTLARLVGRDFREHGVSLVNVGGTGLRRFGRIFMRAHPAQGNAIKIPVACIADIDVMPDCAPWIVGMLKEGEGLPDRSHRRWRVKSDFGSELKNHQEELRTKSAGQSVETFVADEWTLEYDLARSGLAAEVWIAAHLAASDTRIHDSKIRLWQVVRNARKSFAELCKQVDDLEKQASHVYACFIDGASKAVAAQYLAEILEWKANRGKLKPDDLLAKLPPYLVNAIEHVTSSFEKKGNPGDGGESKTG